MRIRVWQRFAALAIFWALPVRAELQNVQVGRGVQVRNPMRMPVTLNGVSLQRDQTSVSVTVYNNNLALVRDSRRMHIENGEHTIRFEDVAAQIRPETVKFGAQEFATIRVLEQNYEYDLISPRTLMDKYVGRIVKLQDFNAKSSAGTVEAELLSVNEGAIYKVGSEIFVGRPGTIALPQLPENLAARPTLTWLIESPTNLEADFDVSYLTGGISWSADYVLTLAKDETSLGIEGWVTLGNQSGASYENAQLKVVAGEVNMVREELIDGSTNFWNYDTSGGAGTAMREETFAEYHLYTLPRRTTIKQNQSKQVSLLSADGVAVAKRFEYRGNASYYSQQIAPIQEEKVGVFLICDNKEANRLGMPLPAGVMRVYQEDEGGALQFSGEDRIEHTPRDEEVRLRLGNAFDVVGERIQTDFRVIADNVFESSYEIAIRNHKNSDIAVDVIEPMDGDWAVLAKSHEYLKQDARTAVFSLAVPRNGEVNLNYSVRVSHGDPIGIPLPVGGPRPMAKPLISPR